MLAAQYNDNHTDLTCVNVVSVPKPEVRPNFALVKVVAASANPIDIMVMKGFLKGAGWTMPLPFTVGYDFSGVVEAVGEGVAAFAPGDEVFAVNWGQHKHHDVDMPVGGAFAEYICIPASKLSRKPAGLSFEEAAAVALVGTTAYQILFDCAKVSSGSKVLILGGSSAVGSIAIQLAKSRGAWVATTASPRTYDFVSQFGADKIINYLEAKWESDPELKSIDAVIDTVGEPSSFSKSRDNGVLKETGSFVSISSNEAGYNPAAHPPLSFASFYCLKNDSSHQDELASMIVSGALKVVIDKTFDFSQDGVRALLEYQQAGKSCGKNVLRFSSSS